MRARASVALLAGALLLGGAWAASERLRLRAESEKAVEAVFESAERAARDSLIARDPFMLVSHILVLRDRHPELAFAAVTRDGHESAIGSADEELVWREREVTLSAGPTKWTVTAPSGANGRLEAGPNGLTLRVDGDAKATEDAPPSERVGLKLGFSRRALDAAADRALRAALARASGVAAVSLAFGALAALALLGGRKEGESEPALAALPAPPLPLLAGPDAPPPLPRCSLREAIAEALDAVSSALGARGLAVANYAELSPLVCFGRHALVRAAIEELLAHAAAGAHTGARIWLGLAQRGGAPLFWASYQGAAPDEAALQATAARAERLGGRLRVERADGAGAVLFLELRAAPPL